MRRLSLVTTLAFLMVVLGARPGLAGEPTADWVTLRLQNGGAEIGDTTGWMRRARFDMSAERSYLGVGPFAGLFLFRLFNAREAWQDLRLPAGRAVAKAIATGRLVVRAQGQFRAFSTPGNRCVRVELRFFDNDGISVGGAESEAALSQTDWQFVQHFARAPASARTVRVTLEGSESAGNPLCNTNLLIDEVAAAYCLAPEQVRLSAPESAVRIGLRPTLRWDLAGAASDYEVQVARDRSFTKIDVERQVTGATNTHRLEQSLRRDTLYYWRVRGVSECAEGEWSTARYFYTRL